MGPATTPANRPPATYALIPPANMPPTFFGKAESTMSPLQFFPTDLTSHGVLIDSQSSFTLEVNGGFQKNNGQGLVHKTPLKIRPHQASLGLVAYHKTFCMNFFEPLSLSSPVSLSIPLLCDSNIILAIIHWLFGMPVMLSKSRSPNFLTDSCAALRT